MKFTYAKMIAAVALFAGMATSGYSQCTNSSSFGSATAPATVGVVTTVTTCQWATEYHTLFSVVGGSQYRSTSSIATDFITVHQGSPAGPVVGFGTTPLTWTATASGNYYVHYNTNSSCGTNTVCRTATIMRVTGPPPPPAPANDNCATPSILVCGTTVSGNTTTATDDLGAPFCGTSAGFKGVWYVMFGGGENVTLSTCGLASWDTKINVYTGSCSGLTCITGIDDFCGLQSQVSFVACAGQPYFVLVSGFSSLSSGAFSLSATCTPATASFSGLLSTYCLGSASSTLTGSPAGGTFSGPGIVGNVFNPALAGVGTHIITYTSCVGSVSQSTTVTGGPANDSPCGAFPIAVGGSSAFNNLCATADAGEVSPGGGTDPVGGSCDSQDGWCAFETGIQSSVWFSFVAPASGCVSISQNNTLDLQFAVWSAGSCSNYATFSEEAANDDGGAGFAAQINQLSCLIPGQTYYLQVDGYAGTRGTAVISVSDCGNAPLACEAPACQQNLFGWDGLPADTNYLNFEVSGGFPPYTYTWTGSGIIYTNGAGAAVVPPTTAGTYTYCLTTTDAKGCQTTCCTTIESINVDCSVSRNAKVLVCHVPPGNPAMAHTICISENAVPAHVAGYGGAGGHDNDYLGPCGQPCRGNVGEYVEFNPCSGGTFTVNIPGPASRWRDEMSWTLVGASGATVLSGGSLGFGGTTSVSVTTADVPLTFNIEVNGFFNDNAANWNVTCGGGVVASGSVDALAGNFTNSVGDICCGASVTPRMGNVSSSVPGAGIVVGPNPFSTSATFVFRTPVAGSASLDLFNLEGVKVATVFNGNVEEQGRYEVSFTGNDLAAGVYFYRLSLSNGAVTTGKVVYTK